MAKIRSHIWSSAAGSVGGITYFNGPHHAILARARVVPVQPGTLHQSQMRSAMSEAAAQWDALTALQQQDWEIYAQTCTYQGKQGNYEVTGRSMFMAGRSLQRYIFLRGLEIPTFVVTPPVVTGFLVPSDFALAPPTGIGTGFQVRLKTDVNDPQLTVIQVSGPKGDETNFWKGPWDTRKTETDISAADTNVLHDILGLVDGAKYFVRVKCVADDAAPRTSTEWFGSTYASVSGP